MAGDKDIVVVGGGIIGLACAHYLALEGRRVCLVDQQRIGAGASHGNCGLLFFSHLMPLCSPGVLVHEIRRLFRRDSPLYISPAPDRHRLAWLARFATHCTYAHLEAVMRARAGLLSASARLYDELFDAFDLPCDRQQAGVLLVYRSAGQLAAYEATNARLVRFGHGARRLSALELVRLEPALRTDLAGGWYHPHDSHLRPDFLLASWKQVALSLGVDFIENCRLEAIGLHRGRIAELVTGSGAFKPKAVVLATGAWTRPLAARVGIHLPLEPGKGYSLTMARPPAAPQRPCYFHDCSVVATPWDSGLRLGGTMEFSGLNTEVVPRRLAALKTTADGYLRTKPAAQAMEAWVGLRPVMADDLPVIDRVAQVSNLVIATGHGMMGLSMATGTGKIVADLIAGRAPQINQAPFALKRLGTRGGIGR